MFQLITVGLLIAVATTNAQSSAQICYPSFPFFGEGGFNVCLFGKTNDTLTHPIGALGNVIWSAQAALYLGSCYCRQDCTPSQIVCDDAVDLGVGNVTNGIAKIVYNAEAYQFYCYCPKLIPAGVNPCANPPQPGPCDNLNLH